MAAAQGKHAVGAARLLEQVRGDDGARAGCPRAAEPLPQHPGLSERAAAGPFGGTVAHGFLTLSLISYLQEQAGRVAIPGLTMTVNYGLDRVRFPHPVRSGSRIRLATTLAAAEAGAPGTIRLSHDLAVEIEGAPKPALVATWITLCFV